MTPENFPNLKKKTDIQGIGSTEGPKQDESKQNHTNKVIIRRAKVGEKSKGSKRKTESCKRESPEGYHS